MPSKARGLARGRGYRVRRRSTGGIDLAKAQDYLKLRNVACVGGSWMLPKEGLAKGDYAAVEKPIARSGGASAQGAVAPRKPGYATNLPERRN